MHPAVIACLRDGRLAFRSLVYTEEQRLVLRYHLLVVQLKGKLDKRDPVDHQCCLFTVDHHGENKSSQAGGC